ncbi:chaperonin, putative [Ichthyophthirius multifiliis]|uniref:Chaperonin, putative n=1 Tax=Ichthyophthirius multifiliis TaxID=5932 RepID=G0R246_ICHMU|nr:chaperonin, putative [Ichthyophthirius multifiliis]EGR28453.1 chaperonin, putative [Ichthyophthirius multifiliis]|eukprot:XP_004029689.1 chaperonin, putative [Ichthyophthirius multifiliis]
MFKKILPITLGSFGSYLIYDYNSQDRILYRNLRTLKTGFIILYNYKIRFSPENVNQIHEETAAEIYNLCKSNDGLYVKFGQQIAAQDHILPPAYFKYFSSLQDQATSVPYLAVERIIKNDLGKKPDEIFSYFEKEPIASASIAQVHKARLCSGEEVAVKVQKPNIKGQFKSDMFMHWLFLTVLEKAFDLPLSAFHQSIEENLGKEIDFRIEAQNAKKCSENFLKLNRKDIYVPEIYKEYTTPRILVMEWINGIKITEENELIKQGFQPKKLVQSIIEGFAEQIFISGFTHADPHPGNILIRRNPLNKSQEQIVLLDYGLCYQTQDFFREQYCMFWKYLFLQNNQQLRNIVKQWGITDDEAFASSQLMRPYQKNKPILKDISKTDVYNLQLKFKGDVKKMLGDTEKFPKDLIYINRNMNLVRSINKRLGSKVNRISIMAKYSVEGLNSKSNSFKARFNVFWFQMRLLLSQMIYQLVQTWFKITTGKGFEEIIEENIKQTINERYQQYGMIPPDENTFNA